MIETELAKTNSNAAVRVKKIAEDLNIIFGVIKKRNGGGGEREKKECAGREEKESNREEKETIIL